MQSPRPHPPVSQLSTMNSQLPLRITLRFLTLTLRLQKCKSARVYRGPYGLTLQGVPYIHPHPCRPSLSFSSAFRSLNSQLSFITGSSRVHHGSLTGFSRVRSQKSPVFTEVLTGSRVQV